MKTRNLLSSVLVWLVLVMSTLCGNAQMVGLSPTNCSYSLTVRQNVSVVPGFKSWKDVSRIQYQLDAEVLIITRTVYHHLPFNFADMVIEYYRQVGPESYEPIGYDEVHVVGVTGGVHGSTNSFPASRMFPITWYPTKIGTTSTTDGYLQTIEVGSPVLFFARNLANGPQILDIPCRTQQQTMRARRLFQPREKIFYLLGLSEANNARLSNQPAVSAFVFNEEEIISFPPNYLTPVIPKPPKLTKL